MASLETSKIRERVLKYCEGIGIDIGCRDDKIIPEALGFDKSPFPEVDIVGDASRTMPFEDEHFDYIYSSHCLEDIPDTNKTLQEWLRILKKSGKIILHLPHKDHYKGYNKDHCQEFVNSDIEIYLKKFGCKIIESYVDSGENRYSFVVVGEKI